MLTVKQGKFVPLGAGAAKPEGPAKKEPPAKKK